VLVNKHPTTGIQLSHLYSVFFWGDGKIEIQAKAAAVLQPHEFPHLCHKARLPVRREPHHLVFISVMRKPQILGHGLVEDSQRVGKIDPIIRMSVSTEQPAKSPRSSRVGWNDQRLTKESPTTNTFSKWCVERPLPCEHIA
jgi:hypothetical protein